ncbi:hypothetical protein Lalb_Chr09g0335231 [Lupinus albus]|uniref:Uncharacterized protein n=1 Tax=Lupinus albus TaxID=3870 RepID=A0A6A4Q247_LUPAL|nr:hypothetical protein Lalb_Chr09g0335231 [Lupinus albus]
MSSLKGMGGGKVGRKERMLLLVVAPYEMVVAPYEMVVGELKKEVGEEEGLWRFRET